jgi:hypothetical protein
MIKYCTNCFLPSIKPDLLFHNNGKCAACISFEERISVDWEKRKKEFVELVSFIPKKSKSHWDCLVPVSGGKDSTIQVLKILELGFKPLCVTATTCDLTPIGRKNIENIKQFGVDYIEFTPNPTVRRKLNKIGLEQVGDISWPEHVGIFTIPIQAAVQYEVPLVIWGENSQNEYGGPAASAKNNVLTRRWLEEFGGMLGLRVSDMSDAFGIPDTDLLPYRYPTDSELTRVGVTGLFLGHYFPWDGLSNYILAQAKGFSSYGKVIEGSVVDYENLDNYQTGIHDYFKFLKYGFGRATDIVSLHMRRGRINREQGLDLIKQHDGRYPHSYLGKPLSEIIAPLDINIEEFDAICEKFTNKDLFLKNSNGSLMRDSKKNLIKINYDN